MGHTTGAGSSATFVHITLLGMDARERNLFESFLGIIEGHDDIQVKVTDRIEQADLLVFDSDTCAQPDHETASQVRMLVPYGQPADHGGARPAGLTKPLRFTELRTVIHLLSSGCASPRPGSEPIAPGLYPLLREADRDAPLAIQLDQHTIVTDPERGRCYLPDGLQDPAPLYAASPERLAIEPASDAALQAAAASGKSVPLLRLWWQAALAAHPGILPDGVTPDTPVALHRWPDLGAVGHQPHYAALCARITRSALAPAELARQSGIHADTVADFLRASAFCGYLEIRPAADTPSALATEPAPAEPAAQPSLIARIKKRLGLGTTTAPPSTPKSGTTPD